MHSSDLVCSDAFLLIVGCLCCVQVGAAATATAGAIQNYAQKQMATPTNGEPAKISPHFKRG